MLRAEFKEWETSRLEGYSIESTLDQGADTLKLEIGMGALGENAGKIQVADTVKLYDSQGKQLMAGIIDDVDEGDLISIEGRDLFGLAIEHYPDPKRYKNRFPLNIIKEIAGQLEFSSVDVSGVTTSQTKLKAFQIEAGNSAGAMLQELAEEADCELYVDRLGNLIARNFPDRQEKSDFNFVSLEGEANCNIEQKRTSDEVYSTIKLYRGRSNTPTIRTDDQIEKIVNRTLSKRDGDVRSAAQAGKRIEQMFRDMKDQIRRWEVTYGGTHDKFGEIPKIGDGALVTSYRHKVTKEPATIWSVKLEMSSKKGSTTTVELRSREF